MRGRFDFAAIPVSVETLSDEELAELPVTIITATGEDAAFEVAIESTPLERSFSSFGEISIVTFGTFDFDL